MKIDNLIHVLGTLHKILLHLNEMNKLGYNVHNVFEPTFKYNSITGDGNYIIEYTYETDPDFYPLTLRIYPTSPIGIHDISSISLDPDGETSIEYNNDSKPEFYIDDIKKLFNDEYVFQQSTVHDVGSTNGQFWNTCYYHMIEICKLLKGVE
ncbi:hypothetical protein ACRYKS_20020 [Escherichia coli]|uniref:hypothetical protein n=1 Tax=Escherichia coli TaxID=562 RepID=UPI0027A80E9E|nr:hypothetical protein [Escherichia coli]WGM49688.1 hypothetical protein EcMJ_446 [Escherichia phage vB_Ec-M-J]HBB3761132.1 hypothetical protein [Escherichia coli]